MLIKPKDDPAPHIALLERLLQRPDVPDHTRLEIEEELAKLRFGHQGERDVAYYLEFEFIDSPDWAIIHDLRLLANGRQAQIDHLLINRWLEIYVLESKAFRHKLKITADGQFLFWNARRRTYQAIESPVVQVRRHQRVLDQVLRDVIWPRWKGRLPAPRYFPLVLITPQSRLVWDEQAPQRLRKYIVLADRFADELQRYTKHRLLTGKRGKAILTEKGLRTLARQIAALHTPYRPDYYARFKLPRRPRQHVREARGHYTPPNPPAQQAEEAPARKRYFCARCGKTISPRVAMFCFAHKERFGGRAYCLDCQRLFPPRQEAKR